MKKLTTTLFILSIMGSLFSGYLSGVKFFTHTCAFKESCPYFLGYPACYFGFAMFFTLLVFSSLLFFNKIQKGTGTKVTIFVSALGILFAGYFTFRELPILFKSGLSAYILGLPTCAMGFVFFILVFIFSVKLKKTAII